MIPGYSLISYMSDKVKAGGGINLAQGLPGFPPPDELTAILRELATGPVHQYAPGSGDAELRALIPSLFGAGGPSADRCLITNGATEAVTLVYLYLKSRANGPFSTLAFDPAYESYRHLPRIFGDRFHPFAAEGPLTEHVGEFRRAVRESGVRLVCVASPGNPWGRIFSEKEWGTLLELSEELGFSVLADGVYRELYLNERPYLPVDRISPRLFYADSFSKTLSITGWRVGFLAAHEEHLPALRQIHDYTALSSPSVLQKAIARYLAAHGGADYLAALRRQVKGSFDYLHAALTGLGFRIPPIGGGYFIWARLPDGWSDGLDFAERLYKKERVAVVPGVHFSENGEPFVRFNIARPLDEIQEAARRVAGFIAAERP
ncbi:MAG TPA: pyridoxal phosphate-dependent aminotransferase [bacterium]|nr:pyridoxal phosphate-dependent aminotransferase [bacterium]